MALYIISIFVTGVTPGPPFRRKDRKGDCQVKFRQLLMTKLYYIHTLLAVSQLWVRIYCFVPTDIKPISTIFLVALLSILFIHITIAPQPTFNYVYLVSCLNLLVLETANNRFLVASLSPKRNWPISLIVSVLISQLKIQLNLFICLFHLFVGALRCTVL